jgi:hypothetical protein
MTYESECVALKRRGAEYVAQLLSGKSRQEQLEFWIKRTERLLAKKRQEKSKSQHGKEEKIQELIEIL